MTRRGNADENGGPRSPRRRAVLSGSDGVSRRSFVGGLMAAGGVASVGSALLPLPASGQPVTDPAAPTFLLVHGSWHGAWCWYRVIPRLERAGHRVLAPDLPSLGRDTTPIRDVTLESWTDHVGKILDAEPEPVVLVGHSRGGIVISQCAESRPDKVRGLVYLSAFLLRDGETLLQVAQSAPDSLVGANLVVDEAGGFTTVREDAVREAFYGDCSDEDVTLARLLLRPEALAPLGTPLRLSPESYGRVPRYYIECLQDRALPLALQRRMCAATPCRTVLSIDSSHSPFFSSPDVLTEHLLACAREA